MKRHALVEIAPMTGRVHSWSEDVVNIRVKLADGSTFHVVVPSEVVKSIEAV